MNVHLLLQDEMQEQIKWAIKDRGVHFIRHRDQGYIKQAFA